MKFCRSAKIPSSLPKRPGKATTACGWWYIPDPNIPSMGALGRREGPIFPNTLPSSGEWIWSVAEATMKEDIKRCKRIRNCNLIDMKSLKGKCGFCPNLGYSLPVKKNGTELYPDVAACGTPLVTTKTRCPKPTVEPPSSNGISCGTYGRPSEDNNIRLYTEKECSEIDPTASFAGNGECLKSEGGSYSWDCRDLNGPSIKTVNICDPDASGKLTRRCLLSLTQGMGYTIAGTIVRLLSSSTEVKSEMDTMAINVLNTIGIAIPEALFGAGDIDQESAIEIYYQIMDTANSGSEELYREAAKWLVYGTKNFDPCNLPDKTMGPFMVQCIQREFRKAGCQPAGSNYPRNAEQLGKYNDYKWSDLRDEFRNLYSTMASSDGDVQDDSVKKCLGVDVSREPPKPCIDLDGTWWWYGGNQYSLTVKTTNQVINLIGNWGVNGTAKYIPSLRTGSMQFSNGWNTEFNVNDKTIYWQNGGYFIRR
jgi:hypothetical protein